MDEALLSRDDEHEVEKCGRAKCSRDDSRLMGFSLSLLRRIPRKAAESISSDRSYLRKVKSRKRFEKEGIEPRLLRLPSVAEFSLPTGHRSGLRTDGIRFRIPESPRSPFLQPIPRSSRHLATGSPKAPIDLRETSTKARFAKADKRSSPSIIENLRASHKLLLFILLGRELPTRNP